MKKKNSFLMNTFVFLSLILLAIKLLRPDLNIPVQIVAIPFLCGAGLAGLAVVLVWILRGNDA